MRRWEEIFTEGDRSLVGKAGMGIRQEYGSRPALLVIDVTKRFIGSTRQPVLRSVEEYTTSCGEAGWVALPNIQKLLKSCRANDIPVIYTTPDAITSRMCGVPPVKGWKPEDNLDPKADEIPEPIAPLPSELVIRKTKPSAFFGTPLALILQTKGVDTLLFTGTSTSGCVRAAVVDGFSHGFRCFVVEECTFDRFELSHLVNLFDMNAKYADVISLEEALKYLDQVGQLRKKAAVAAEVK